MTKLEFIQLDITISGHDSIYSDKVFARKHYLPEDFVAGVEFEDILHEQPDVRLVVDYDKFHRVKPISGTVQAKSKAPEYDLPFILKKVLSRAEQSRAWGAVICFESTNPQPGSSREILPCT